MDKPKTLSEVIRYYKSEENCIQTVKEMRWPNGVSCPACGHRQHWYLEKQRRWKCKECWKQFSCKVGTIFEDSALPLDKWLIAMWLLANCKNGISSYEIGRSIGVSQKAAWFMLHRIRLAMKQGSIEKIGGPGKEVESDETYIGQKSRNMHKSRKLRIAQANTQRFDSQNTMSPRYVGKTAVVGMLDREARKVRANVVPNVKRHTLQEMILGNVEHGSKLYTDQAVAYGAAISNKYAHEMVNHLEGYVNGRVHTNGLENFWSLLKRSLHGSYVAVEPFHLFRYVDEQVFRYNHRKHDDGSKMTDRERFELVLSQIAGKRLTFAEVTGKVGQA